MLQRIVDLLHQRSGAELVAIVRVDQTAKRFVCEAVRSSVPTEVVPGYSRELGSGIVGQVALTGQPILVNDVSEVEDFVETQAKTMSEVCLPIRHGSEVVAVLNLESSNAAYFAGQLADLEAVADVVSGAISGARLLQSLRERSEQLELLSEILRLGFSRTKLKASLEAIARRICEAFNLILAAIVVADEAGTEWIDRAVVLRGLGKPQKVRLHWPVTAGVVGRAIREGQPLLVTDASRDPDYFALDSRVQAEYVVPFRLQGRILGALNLESDDPAVFSSENCALFRHLAEQLVAPIALARANRDLARANRDLARANRDLERLNRLDPLTGLANRRALSEAIHGEWRRAFRRQQPLAIVVFDVDHFKAYNDCLGHGAGDRVLRSVGALLNEAVRRAEDLVARYGGEEFVLLLPGLELEGARTFADRLRGALEALNLPHPGSPIGCVTMSAGVAAGIPSAEVAPAAILEAADRALYRAKNAGRNRVETESLRA